MAMVAAALLLVGANCSKDSAKKKTSDAVVVHVAGKAILARKEQQSDLKFRDLVKKGDQVITKKKSSVSLQIADIGIVRLDANSKFTFENLDKEEIQLKLKSGNISAKFKKLKKS